MSPDRLSFITASKDKSAKVCINKPCIDYMR